MNVQVRTCDRLLAPYRFGTAGRDIAQHRILNPLDWDDDWIFYDSRFGLADNDELLLRFLAEMLNPVVRTDLAEVERLRVFLNARLAHDGYEIVQVGDISGAPVFASQQIGSAVRGSMKNLIFAAIGPKPEVVLDDALNNDLRIVKHEQHCLIYDRPLAAHGLTWGELASWWADRQKLTDRPEREIFLSLHQRLLASLDKDNGAERRIFSAYAKRYREHGAGIPALIPQVYLHYDPYTQSRYKPGTSPLQRQRMDFLLLLPHRAGVVIECDGQQHYADDNGQANPRRYAAMVTEDRELRLKGYEVYRFGGADLTDTPSTQRLLDTFFDRLAERYSA
jgi:very-short-patch-repair endonuclease